MDQRKSHPVYRLFIGVDIAAKTFTVASLVPGTKPKREPKPFGQTPESFQHFQKQLLASGDDPATILIVMEATGNYWIALATTLCKSGFSVSVINPAQAHFFAKAQLKRAKNDALDAEILAELASVLAPVCWTPPPQIYHELYQRLAQRASLVEWRTQISNQLHAQLVTPTAISAVKERLVRLIATLEEQIAEIEMELHDLVQIEEEGEPLPADPTSLAPAWKKTIGLLLTIPGIGILAACWLVVSTLNFSVGDTAEAVANFIGLAPITRTSGTSVRGRGQIGHSGHGRV